MFVCVDNKPFVLVGKKFICIVLIMPDIRDRLGFLMRRFRLILGECIRFGFWDSV